MSEIVKAETTLVEIALEIRTEVEYAERDFQSAVVHAIRAGELLTEAKAQVRHGEWLPWLEANFPASVRSAQGYMRLAARAEDAQALAHLGIEGALKQLAAPREDPRWAVWRDDCRSISDSIPPTLDEWTTWLATGPLSVQLPLDVVAQAHVDWLRDTYGVPFWLQSERFLPPPPTFEPDRSPRIRLQVWELELMRAAGELLGDLDNMGLDRDGRFTFDPKLVNVEAAQAVIERESSGWDGWRSEWAESDVRLFAVGYAVSRLIVPKGAW